MWYHLNTSGARAEVTAATPRNCRWTEIVGWPGVGFYGWLVQPNSRPVFPVIDNERVDLESYRFALGRLPTCVVERPWDRISLEPTAVVG